MERPFHFDFRDVLWAPARALSAKKILVMTGFLCLAFIVYDIFFYLALLITGEDPGTVFNVYGFFPVFKTGFQNVTSGIVFGIGLALSGLALMMGFFAVAAINIEEVRGNRFLSISGSVKFAFRRLTQMFYSELAIALLIGSVILLYVILGFICRLPVVGPWVYSFLVVIPGFIVAILTVFVVLIFHISFLLLPATAAADRTGETFNTILETFSTVIRQPFRWLGYTVYAVIASKVCGFIYAYFCFRAVQFATWAASLGGGEEVIDLVRSGLSHLPANSGLVTETFNIFPGLDWSFSIAQWTRSGGDGPAAGYLMAVMLFLIFASIIGYMLAIIATAQARGYVALRYIKDNYNICDEKPLFFTDEPVNPPCDTSEDNH